MQSARVDLFRLLGDEDRLRLLALCAEEELTVGELASLIGESQPQVTKKTQPLREAGLLTARRDGTRTLLRAAASADVILGAALEEGRLLCTRDGSLARIAAIVAQREELSRKFFEQPAELEPAAGDVELLLSWLAILGPLLPRAAASHAAASAAVPTAPAAVAATAASSGETAYARSAVAATAASAGETAYARSGESMYARPALAVDAGTGEGTLLPLLSPLYERVVAVDRSPARLARCGARIAAWGLPNVRLREGEIDDAALLQEISQRGGADLVVLARVLRYAARPEDALTAAARLARPGGHVLVVDSLPHDDESARELGDVWLGFQPAKLRAYLTGASLEVIALHPLPGLRRPPLQLAVGKKPSPHRPQA
jgi:ArsR family transcriptional regulator